MDIKLKASKGREAEFACPDDLHRKSWTASAAAIAKSMQVD